MQSLDRPPLKLLCTNPEFIEQPEIVQTSVRVGTKWRDDLKGKVQPRVPVFNTESNEQLGTATVVGSLFGSFKDFGYIGAAFNREERCRELDVLAEDLAKYYPDFDPETSQITVLFLKYSPVEKVEEEAPPLTDADGNLLSPSEDDSENKGED